MLCLRRLFYVHVREGVWVVGCLRLRAARLGVSRARVRVMGIVLIFSINYCFNALCAETSTGLDIIVANMPRTAHFRETC